MPQSGEIPKQIKAVVLVHGDVPDDSVAMNFAKDVARGGSNVIVSDADAQLVEKEEGLPTRIVPADSQSPSSN